MIQLEIFDTLNFMNILMNKPTTS